MRQIVSSLTQVLLHNGFCLQRIWGAPLCMARLAAAFAMEAVIEILENFGSVRFCILCNFDDVIEPFAMVVKQDGNTVYYAITADNAKAEEILK